MSNRGARNIRRRKADPDAAALLPAVIARPGSDDGPRLRATRGGADGQAVPAFLAQIIGARLGRCRLGLAREQAGSIHRAYLGSGGSVAGGRIDISI
jgi:hypothetical protein